MKFPVQNWQCSVDGWMQFQFKDKPLISTDDLQKTWAHNSSEFKLVRAEDNSLIIELLEPCRLFRVEGGEIEIHDLKPGTQFQLAL